MDYTLMELVPNRDATVYWNIAIFSASIQYNTADLGYRYIVYYKYIAIRILLVLVIIWMLNLQK